MKTLDKIQPGNWREFDSFCWYERPDDADDYAIVYVSNRDSGLLDQSNAKAIDEALQPYIETGEAIPQRHSHWAVGHVDGYALKGKALATYQELMERMEDYPLLDEEDYSKREYEATLENIRNEAHYANRNDLYELPEDYDTETLSWLWNHNQGAVENRDEQGGYPTEEELQEAWEALGYR
jgi:hypothetical protein